MKHIEIVTIGNELLDGMIVNTNASYLCQQLKALGLTVSAYHAIPDERNVLKRLLKRTLLESSLVICTGGLGPTLDDNTRQVAAEIFDSGFRFDDGIAAALRERYGNDLASLHNQATVPAKAIVLPNSVGTAPALIFEGASVTLILLPGPPLEMHAIFEQSVIPYLQVRLPEIGKRVTEYLILAASREDEVDPVLRELQETLPNVDAGIYAKLGSLTIALSTFQEDAEARRELDQAKQVLMSRFPDRVVFTKRGKIEEDIQELLIKNNATLSTAESCTGGSIAAALTAQAGASQYFLGSVVAYSNEVKKRLLGVKQSTLDEHGAVSEEVVIEMARGALLATGSDYSVAVTGVAGPTGGSDKKPIGTVWLGVASRHGIALTWRLKVLHGDRAKIIAYTVNVALCRLWQTVNTF